jgi:TATA-binding protein-associated factor
MVAYATVSLLDARRRRTTDRLLDLDLTDMGLGKSLQSICMIAGKHEERRARFEATGSPDAAHLPSLIICPTTLIGHWFHEITKFTNNLRPFKYYGSTSERTGLRRQFQYHDVIVTSYEIIRSDMDFMRRQNFLYCILDEGHMIKNAKSKLTLAVKSLQSVHRLILSGTPIQNNVLELWSLFDFLMPGFLGTEKEFNDRFSKPILANKDAKATAKQKEAGKSGWTA